MSDHNETLRFPINLDRAEILRRLVKVRESAQSKTLPDLASRFTDVENMSAAQIGVAVVGALAWLEDRAPLRPLAIQLEMVAVNLKNLK